MTQCTNCWSWHTHGGNCEVHNATGGNADAPSMAATMAVMGQQLTDENAHLRAQLAQREGEIEALRGEMKAERARHLKAEADHDSFLKRLSEDVSRAFGINAREEWQEAFAALRAALSDNPESPALTDKEA